MKDKAKSAVFKALLLKSFSKRSVQYSTTSFTEAETEEMCFLSQYEIHF